MGKRLFILNFQNRNFGDDGGWWWWVGVAHKWWTLILWNRGKREGGKSKPPKRRKCLFFKSVFFWLLDISGPNLLGISNSILYHKQTLTCLAAHLELIPSNHLNSSAPWNQGRKCWELGESFQEKEVKSDSSKFWIPLLSDLHPIARNQTTQRPKHRSCWRPQGSEFPCKLLWPIQEWKPISCYNHIEIIIYNEISQAG